MGFERAGIQFIIELSWLVAVAKNRSKCWDLESLGKEVSKSGLRNNTIAGAHQVRKSGWGFYEILSLSFFVRAEWQKGSESMRCVIHNNRS